MNGWNRWTRCFVVLFALAPGAWLGASDPVGIYALVERVVLEPGPDKPERIQLWGAFAFAKGYGDTYASPARGYLYYRFAAGKEEACRNEWADLAKLAQARAGAKERQNQAVSFGSRYMEKGRLRRAADKPENPDPYPIAMGIFRIRKDTNYAPIDDLFALPGALAPVDGGDAPAGPVTLVVSPIGLSAHTRAKYVFELERAEGVKKEKPAEAAKAVERETSPPIVAGEKDVRWSPKLEVKPHVRYVWRVRAVDGDWQGPVASFEFQGKPGPVAGGAAK